MNEHAVRVYLELCRESVLDQDRVNRVYSTKASGIITFGAALFGIGEPWRHLAGGGVALMDGAKYYRAMIAFNDKALLLKEKFLTFITWAAVAELVCFIVLTAFR